VVPTLAVVPPVAVHALPEKQIQGAARYDRHWHLNRSHLYSGCSLWRAAVGDDGTLAVTGAQLRTGIGAEDMDVEHGQAAGRPRLLWSLTEHHADITGPSCAATSATPCGRVVYAPGNSDVLAQP